MSRLTVELTEQQHQAVKARAALNGQTMKEYTVERLFSDAAAGGDDLAPEDTAWLREEMAKRLARIERGEAKWVDGEEFFARMEQKYG